jgi:hypothetical protein
MDSACSDHVTDTGPLGLIGNTGSDDSSPFDRVDRFGVATNVDQNMGYKRTTALEMVL